MNGTEFTLMRPEWSAIVRSVQSTASATDLTIKHNGYLYRWTGLNRPARSRHQLWVADTDPTYGDVYVASQSRAVVIQERDWTPKVQAPELDGKITQWTAPAELGAVPGWGRLVRRMAALGFYLDNPQRLLVRAAVPILMGYNGWRPIFQAAIQLDGRPRKILGIAYLWDVPDVPVPVFHDGYLGDVFVPGDQALFPSEAVGVILPDGRAAFAAIVRPGTVLATDGGPKATVKSETSMLLTVPA